MANADAEKCTYKFKDGTICGTTNTIPHRHYDPDHCRCCGDKYGLDGKPSCRCYSAFSKPAKEKMSVFHRDEFGGYFMCSHNPCPHQGVVAP